jgi:hypothetical protein
MGRPTIFKKGALTAAERQKRHRIKLRKQRREDEAAASRERSYAQTYAQQTDPEYQRRLAEARKAFAEDWEAKQQERLERYGPDPLPEANSPADELARQIAEWLVENPEVAIADVRTALDRRFGRRRKKTDVAKPQAAQ